MDAQGLIAPLFIMRGRRVVNEDEEDAIIITESSWD